MRVWAYVYTMRYFLILKLRVPNNIKYCALKKKSIMLTFMSTIKLKTYKKHNIKIFKFGIKFCCLSLTSLTNPK